MKQLLKLWNIRFVRFLVVGGINTVFGYSVYAFFIYIGLHYSLAALFATILGVLFNFKTTGKIVFDNSNNSLLLKFIGVYLITYLISLAFLKGLVLLKINLYLAGALVILPNAVIAYLLNKRFVFMRLRINDKDVA
jgi:putative flippase GtrA